MRRITAHAAVALIVGGLLNPVATMATATAAAADTYGAVASDVPGLDPTPPSAVTDLQVVPDYRSATFSFTRPTDADYAYAVYAVAPGNDPPSRENAAPPPTSLYGAWHLTMGTAYTLAVWSIDTSGNASEPAVAHFTTLLDTQPPGPVTGLSATGGDYQVSASWTPPTDSDLDTLTARLTDTSTGTVTAVTLAKTAGSYTWSSLAGGRSYAVSVAATDVNGLTSDVVATTALTNPDANGAPAPVDPATVIVTPYSSSVVMVSFPKPAIPDLKAVGYAIVPLGQDPASYTTAKTLVLDPRITVVSGAVTLPQPMTGYQLVLLVWDYNGNVAQSVVPEVEGVPSAAELPVAPERLTVTSPADNSLAVSWTSFDGHGTRATNWTVTASSGSLTRTVTVPGVPQPIIGLYFHADLTDLPGRQDWTVTVTGTNALGTGPTGTADAVTVADDTAPALVTAATRTPATDVEVLTWVNPMAFDFDHVVVTRLGTTAAETQELYSGSGTSARAVGLLPGHSYIFEIRAYDRLGNVAAAPVRLSTLESALALNGPAAVGYGGSATLTGSLTWNGTRLGGRAVSIQAQAAGSSTWTQVAVATTSTTGAFTATVRPSVNTRYRAAYAGSGAIGGAYSPGRALVVVPAVSIRANGTSVRLGGAVAFTTVVAPRHPGGSILLLRWTGTSWATVAVRTLSADSTASAIVRPPSRGLNTYRWFTPADPAHAAGYSIYGRVTVY